MRDKIAKIARPADVTTDLYIKNPQMTIEIDREKAAVYGITIDQVRQELFNAFGTRQVATIYTRDATTIRSFSRAKPEFQADPSSLSKHLREDQRGRRRPPAERRARAPA